MQCKNCGHDNPVEALFCAGCGAALVAAAEPRVIVSTGQTATVPPVAVMEYAGVWRRFAAAIIDVLIIQAAVMVLLLGSGFSRGMAPALSYGFLAPLVALLPWLYHWLFIGLKGQTPGKMALGIKVISNGKVPGLGTAALREIPGKIISSVLLFLGFLWIIWDSQQQGWHDKIARTYVVRATDAGNNK